MSFGVWGPASLLLSLLLCLVVLVLCALEALKTRHLEISSIMEVTETQSLQPENKKLQPIKVIYLFIYLV